MDFDLLTPEIAQLSEVAPKAASRSAAARAVVRVAARFEATPERVFDAWLDPGIAGKWLFATALRPMTRVAIDARVGGAFRFVDRNDGGHVEHAGVYLEIIRPWRLVFTLSVEKSRTRVTADIVSRDDGCELTLAHENVLPDRLAHLENRWTGMFYGLGQMLGSLSAARARGR